MTTLIGAANRDPEAYDHPDTFDIMRRDGPANLAFSSGIHYCLGHALARSGWSFPRTHWPRLSRQH